MTTTTHAHTHTPSKGSLVFGVDPQTIGQATHHRDLARQEPGHELPGTTTTTNTKDMHTYTQRERCVCVCVCECVWMHREEATFWLLIGSSWVGDGAEVGITSAGEDAMARNKSDHETHPLLDHKQRPRDGSRHYQQRS